MEPNRLGLGAWPAFPGSDSKLYKQWQENTGEVQNDDAQQRTVVTDLPSSAAAAGLTGNPFKENIRLDHATGRPLALSASFVSPTKRKEYAFDEARSKHDSMMDGGKRSSASAPPQPE